MRLGRTLGELMESMSTREFALWKEFDRTSPISDDRADVLAAHVASTVARAAGSKVSLTDMMLRWQPEITSDQEQPSGEGAFKAFLQSRISDAA